MTDARPRAATFSKPPPRDAIALLVADHEAVQQMFAEYRSTRSAPIKKALVAEICLTLSVHSQIKEEIFYPEMKQALEDASHAPQDIEHQGVKDLISQIEGVEPYGELYDAQVEVLSDRVRYHVMEEHSETFPVAKASSVDMIELGSRMAARRQDLLARAA